MNLKEVKVGDWYMKYDDETCYYGITHLLDILSWDERKVFLDEAYNKGAAEFEDRDRRNYTLYWQNGGYLLTRRPSSKW
ncbi:MAG: hypothetical protein Q7R62_02850 [bacterium]|nr:hypothetical protein [bacterium]